MQLEERIRVQHMIEAAETALGFVEGRQRGDLDDDRMLVFAAGRQGGSAGELETYVRTLLGVEPILLVAAGALAIEASGEQVHRLLEHPLVKAIRPNRRLVAPKPRLASG